jgi:hypothetical protein
MTQAQVNAYVAGSLVQTTVTFTNESGVATDPGSVTLTWGLPGEATTWTYGSGQITRVSTGVYQATFDTTNLATSAPTVAYYQWEGTAPLQAIGWAALKVTPPPL